MLLKSFFLLLETGYPIICAVLLTLYPKKDKNIFHYFLAHISQKRGGVGDLGRYDQDKRFNVFLLLKPSLIRNIGWVNYRDAPECAVVMKLFVLKTSYDCTTSQTERIMNEGFRWKFRQKRSLLSVIFFTNFWYGLTFYANWMWMDIVIYKNHGMNIKLQYDRKFGLLFTNSALWAELV